MMGNAPRAAGVLRAVAELARWYGPGPRDGRARGVAVVESFGSFVAQIAEVSPGDGPAATARACTRSGARSIAASPSTRT